MEKGFRLFSLEWKAIQVKDTLAGGVGEKWAGNADN